MTSRGHAAVWLAALVPCAAAGSGEPPAWFYKSPHACTNSDGPETQKCRVDAKNWGCAGSIDTMYCGEEDKQTCKEIGAGVSADSPEGFGFMCPSLMQGTAEMIAAAEADGYDGAYGVVTIDALSCGQCVEITNDDPVHFPNAPKITAQVFNSVANSVDVYMAGGGLGANNGCAAVKDYEPMSAMYEKYPTAANAEFVRHLEKIGYAHAAKLIDNVISYAGGLRGGRTYADCMSAGNGTVVDCQPPDNGCDGGGGVCITDPEVACPLAFVGKSDFVTQKAVESCTYAFEHDLHWNRPITYQVVPCPKSLTQLTGMIPDAAGVGVPGKKVKSTTTTMEDCCEPTCSRASSVQYAKEPGSWLPGQEVIYTCNILGQTYLESTSAYPTPCGEAATAAQSAAPQQPAIAAPQQPAIVPLSQVGSAPALPGAGTAAPAAVGFQAALAGSTTMAPAAPAGGDGGVDILGATAAAMNSQQSPAFGGAAAGTLGPAAAAVGVQAAASGGQATLGTGASAVGVQAGLGDAAGAVSGLRRPKFDETSARGAAVAAANAASAVDVAAGAGGVASPSVSAYSGSAATVADGATAVPQFTSDASPLQGAAPAVPAAVPVAASSPAGQCSSAYSQCGGDVWMGATCCQGSCECVARSDSYSQCVPPDGGASCGGSQASAPHSVVYIRKDQRGVGLASQEARAPGPPGTVLEARPLTSLAAATCAALLLFALAARAWSAASRGAASQAELSGSSLEDAEALVACSRSD